jgi:hypothetical protein
MMTKAKETENGHSELLLDDAELKLLFQVEADVVGVPEEKWEETWEDFRRRYLRSMSKSWANRFRTYMQAHVVKPRKEVPP